MSDLVPLDFVKKALRVDHSDDDTVIRAYIETVSEAVFRYLRQDPKNPQLSETGLPKAVVGAVILGVKSLYDDDQVELLSGLAGSDPKNPLVGLLCMMRKPTLA